jgi:hypothetical protein
VLLFSKIHPFMSNLRMVENISQVVLQILLSWRFIFFLNLKVHLKIIVFVPFYFCVKITMSSTTKQTFSFPYYFLAKEKTNKKKRKLDICAKQKNFYPYSSFNGNFQRIRSHFYHYLKKICFHLHSIT